MSSTPSSNGMSPSGLSICGLSSAKAATLDLRPHDVVQLVPAFTVGWCRIGTTGEQLLDDRAELVTIESLPLLARLPDVEDPEDARILVEPCRVDNSAVRHLAAKLQLLGDGVVIRGAPIVSLDLELLDERNGHRQPPRLGDPMLRRSASRPRGVHADPGGRSVLGRWQGD